MEAPGGQREPQRVLSKARMFHRFGGDRILAMGALPGTERGKGTQ